MSKRARTFWIRELTSLSNKLPIMYPELNLQNHCYRRIAYDMACGERWSDKYTDAFVNSATAQELELAVFKMKQYMINKNKLIEDNKLSLKYRK